MMRTVCYAMVLLASGIAQSAPPEEITPASPPKQMRFLSLAEARAIALENSNIRDPWPRSCGLDSLIQPPHSAPPKPFASIRVLTDLVPGKEGILVAGIPHDARRAELERNINQLLLNLENAYWNLYGSYGQLHSREQGLRFAEESWKIAKAKYAADAANRGSLAQAEGQYNLFRSQRGQALDTVLDNERVLRAMLGMSIEDGTRLVPSDAPTLVEKKPDWEKGLAETLKNRPELHIAREERRVAQLNLLATKYVLRPVLQLLKIEGPNIADASAEPKMDDIAFGRRILPSCSTDHSCVRRAQLQLARAYLEVQDQELKAERFLGLYYRRLSSAYFQIKAARAQREAFATQMRMQSESYRKDGNATTLNLLLEAQRFWADAVATECQAIVTYNNTLAGWEYAKGASMDYAHVTLAEQPPCGGDNVSAVVYQGKRTRMQVRHKLAVSATDALAAPGACSLAALWKRFPPLLDAAELPTVEKVSYPRDEGADKLLTEWKVSDIFSHKRGNAKKRAAKE